MRVLQLVHRVPAIKDEGAVIEPEVETIAYEEYTDRPDMENEYSFDLMSLVVERRNANPQNYTPYHERGEWIVRTEPKEE